MNMLYYSYRREFYFCNSKCN